MKLSNKLSKAHMSRADTYYQRLQTSICTQEYVSNLFGLIIALSDTTFHITDLSFLNSLISTFKDTSFFKEFDVKVINNDLNYGYKCKRVCEFSYLRHTIRCDVINSNDLDMNSIDVLNLPVIMLERIDKGYCIRDVKFDFEYSKYNSEIELMYRVDYNRYEEYYICYIPFELLCDLYMNFGRNVSTSIKVDIILNALNILLGHTPELNGKVMKKTIRGITNMDNILYSLLKIFLYSETGVTAFEECIHGKEYSNGSYIIRVSDKIGLKLVLEEEDLNLDNLLIYTNKDCSVIVGLYNEQSDSIISNRFLYLGGSPIIKPTQFTLSKIEYNNSGLLRQLLLSKSTIHINGVVV